MIELTGYDDSDWTREELESPAWELAEGSDWDALECEPGSLIGPDASYPVPSPDTAFAAAANLLLAIEEDKGKA
jgi:hypothetical protein